MKRMRVGAKGAEIPAFMDDNGTVRSLEGAVPYIAGEVLTREGLAKIAAVDPSTFPAVTADRIGACVGNLGKFLCTGLNYADHAAESGLDIAKEPVMFTKTTSSIIGPSDDIQIPRGSTKTDSGVELGIVVETPGDYIDEAEAMDHVAGHCVVNDVSERAFQIEGGGTWDKGKGCDTFDPIGPWLVTHDEIPDPQNLAMWLEVEGHLYQDGSTRTVIVDVKTIVSYVSQFMSLQPGDVVSTGTPPGMGMGQNPQVYLKRGEVVTLGVEGLGTQTQTVRPAL